MAVVQSSGIDEILEGAVASGKLPGAVFVATGADGEAALSTAGSLSIEDATPVTEATIFRLMSMTKALASVGALQLIEQGKLALDQEVASVLPQFGELKVLDGFDGDQPRLREPRRQATIKHLLTHTAGAGYGFCHADLLRYHELTGHPDPFTGQLAYLGAPLVADPGTQWNYGINTDWLGQVIEKISGQDLASYLKENLFEPLGMTDTTFTPSDEQRTRLMAIHSRTPDGGLALMEIEAPLTAPEFWPAGHGAYGSPRDYSRFMAALLGGGELDGTRVLRPETVDLMFSDHLGGIVLPSEMKSAMPELSNDVVTPPFAQAWGLGLHLFTEDLPGMRKAGSGDWSGLCNTYFWIDRTSGIAAAFFTQLLPFFDQGVLETALAAEATVYAQLRPEASPA